jgi:hypothetical protein
MRIKKTVSIISTLLTLSLIAIGSISHAATITGTVYQSDGITPITGVSIQVAAIIGDPCGNYQWWECAQTNSTNGTYTIGELSDGAYYYLLTDNMSQSNYVNEWYTGQADPSSPDCGLATQVLAGTTGKNFALDMGASISGTVYQSNGITPITGLSICVAAITGDPCGWFQWMGSAQTNSSNGTYTIWGLPVGDYYLLADNMSQSNYVNEWYTGQADPSSPDCGLAIQVATGTTGKNFALDMGASISGTVYQSNGITPITGLSIWVAAIQGDPCGWQQWAGSVQTNSSNGTYTIWGLPVGDYYLHTDNMNQSNYVDEWYTGQADPSSPDCGLAIQVATGATGINFYLDTGGSISGIVVDESDIAQENVEVTYSNEAGGVWKQTYTGSDGSFSLIGLPPGQAGIEVKPEVDTGLVRFVRDYCLNEGEVKDIGTIRLQNGALISGVVKDVGGNPLPDVEYWCGGKFEMGWGETEADGSLAFRLPLGTYSLSMGEEQGYSTMPVEIVVTDVATPQDLGDITAYDSSSGEQISGTVNYGGYAGPGEFVVIAFLITTDITPENAGGISSLSMAEPDPATGAYSLYVVPQAQRVGTMVKVMLCLVHETGDGYETMTVVDTIDSIVTPAAGQNLSYSSGYAVSGFVNDGEGGIVGANVLLYRQHGDGFSVIGEIHGDGENMIYRQPGDEFSGFADTSCDGGYTIYNVPPGTYRIAVNAVDHDPDTVWSGNFEVVDADVTVPDIVMDLLGGELAVDFSSIRLHHHGRSSSRLIPSNGEHLVGYDNKLAEDFGSASLWGH